MIIKKVALKNIRSYEDQEVLIPEGTVLLAGDIGSGKTSLLLAIEYALFGLQPGQRGSSLLRNDSDSGQVTLELDFEGNQVIIERGLKRSTKSISNEYSSITINGQRFESSTTEVKTKVLDLLGYPYEFLKKNNLLYRLTVYTPQEQMKQIILEDKESRLNIIRYIFGIDKYRIIKENIQIILNKFKEESKFIQGEVSSLDEEKINFDKTKGNIQIIEKKIILNEKELLERSRLRELKEREFKEYESKIREKDNFNKEIEKTTILLSTKNETYLEIEKELNLLKNRIDSITKSFNIKEYQQKVNELDELSKSISLLNDSNIKLTERYSSLKNTLSLTNEKKDNIMKISICPTCLQTISSSYKSLIDSELQEQILKMTREISELDLQIKDNFNKILNLRKERQKLEEVKDRLEIAKSGYNNLTEYNSRLDYLEKTKENTQRDISLLSKHLIALKESSTQLTKFVNILKTKQQEINDARAIEKRYEIILAESRKEKELLHKDLISLSDSILLKEKKKDRLNYILELMDWLSNSFIGLLDYMERNIMLKVRREFSELLSKWTALLTDSSLEIRLDDTFSPIISQREIEMEYSFLSGGERTAVALAYRLALNQTIYSTIGKIKTKDLIILDEPTEGFSEQQLDKMREVFEELKMKQILIVSHDPKIEGFVDHIIQISKNDHISIIEPR